METSSGLLDMWVVWVKIQRFPVVGDKIMIQQENYNILIIENRWAPFGIFYREREDTMSVWERYVENGLERRETKDRKFSSEVAGVVLGKK